jgi:hypothetical protein
VIGTTCWRSRFFSNVFSLQPQQRPRLSPAPNQS